MRFYIIDDDRASLKILSRLITDQFLGEVVGESTDASDLEMDIICNETDIVIIDLLMPNQDGIETVQNLKKRNYHGKFIMISQVENKEMIAKAYEEGIEFFIHKPINSIEVTAVIQKVIKQIKMEQSLYKIRESLEFIQKPVNEKKRASLRNIHTILQNILGDLGILGESGSKDLIRIMEYLYKSNKHQNLYAENTSLKDLYIAVLKDIGFGFGEKETKAFEQRIRRTVNQAMNNLASLGLTDYAHPKFEHYATKFFDFNEIRLKMRELTENNGNKVARVNIKKFVHALYTEMIGKLEQEI
ncbi:hypothetical protein BHF71_02405 [Vulcanibacillus modesticaldus]|uniref:Response regulatory domain-containing protein n=1 Tax=Vulcanibacillus modesticaldus TaxID=337097 RepID=A0A1D2YTT4_9BACI|nr:response regulator [Vulcanibacillus modesticaldus]OEF99055.1 hypothetical protein BHF71_02405 [Vulcanibacillus modesticaldus]